MIGGHDPLSDQTCIVQLPTQRTMALTDSAALSAGAPQTHLEQSQVACKGDYEKYFNGIF